jgi:hypothetical protein
LAIVSNIAFIAYGYRAGLLPILVLHLTMLPINVMRLQQEFPQLRPIAIARAVRGGRVPAAFALMLLFARPF